MSTPFISVYLSDGKGSFLVRSNGRIEVKSGYPNVGKLFVPGTPQHGAVVQALAAHSRSNRDHLAQVMGPAVFNKAMAAEPLQTPAGTPATVTDVALDQVVVPFYKQPWFVPAVAGVGALALVGFIILRPKR